MSYKVLGIVDPSEIPDWERTPPKWKGLIDQVIALEPGTTLKLLFENREEALRARAAVRDGASLSTREVTVRTRVINQDDGTAILYLIRVRPSDGEPPK
jgi:hypothetical protein